MSNINLESEDDIENFDWNNEQLDIATSDEVHTKYSEDEQGIEAEASGSLKRS